MNRALKKMLKKFCARYTKTDVLSSMIAPVSFYLIYPLLIASIGIGIALIYAPIVPMILNAWLHLAAWTRCVISASTSAPTISRVVSRQLMVLVPLLRKDMCVCPVLIFAGHAFSDEALASPLNICER